ncbi:hypothetical protein RFI_17015 [Reticulomyxa filosa]|uniref:RRM domain-containing protein n=1 Tax=Reticulomyxa filosa TaxID=46433 RepID=X6N377_RETFI|nr:hypothetical protein RFI_17015 [Reticulomyxa filosa]|eukprot:ETO20204.1 hypothetical protein RFI_17015 [Reticulomyxa filosa]
MSNWIRVINLPFYYDEEEAINMFGDVGSIKRIQIERVQLLLKSTAFIQFVNGRKARLAAIKKDQIVFADSVIRVQVVWSRKETLTTLKVSNLPLYVFLLRVCEELCAKPPLKTLIKHKTQLYRDVTEHSLLEYFSPFGEVVDIDLNKTRDMLTQDNEEGTNSWCDEKMSEPMDNGKVAWVSFARVDYALRACQEMHHSIFFFFPFFFLKKNMGKKVFESVEFSIFIRTPFFCGPSHIFKKKFRTLNGNVICLNTCAARFHRNVVAPNSPKLVIPNHQQDQKRNIFIFVYVYYIIHNIRSDKRINVDLTI